MTAASATPMVLHVGADLRSCFPIFGERAGTVFLDNASTTQKPQQVLEAIERFYRQDCSNAGRANYDLALKAGQAIESARVAVAGFISAQLSEVAFTSGATDSLNAVAWSWGLSNLQDGDEVMVCFQDHNSAVSPWLNIQSVLARFGKQISIVPFKIHEVGDYDLKSIKHAVTAKTRVIALAHIHHVFGLEMEVAEIREIVGPDVVISLDASQSVGHLKVDARELPVDFISFSGHKMFAGNGVGVLMAKESRHAEMTPLRTGGSAGTILSDIDAGRRALFIDKIECGTPNVPSIASMSAAVDFIESVGINLIEKHVSDLTAYMLSRLSELPGIVFAPGPAICGCPGGFGILSFRLEQASSFDVSSALANEQVFVRSGSHCRAQAGGEEDYVRASMHVYNTKEDVDLLVDTLHALVA